MKKILVATAGAAAAGKVAEYVVGIAESLECALVALHIQTAEESAEDAQSALDAFVKAGETNDVPVDKEVRQGDIVTTIIECAEDADAALIIMGASEGNVVSKWVSAGVFDQTTIPVVVIPHQFQDSE